MLRYLKISENSFKSMLAYRLNFFGGLAQSIFSLMIMWFIWNAIFASAGTTEMRGLTLGSMIIYIFISTLMRTYSYSEVEWDMEYDARTGRITRNLTLPMPYPLFRFFSDLGESSYKFLSRGIILIAGGILILKIVPPASILFFASAALAYLINFLLAFLTGLWVFWSGGSIWGLRLSRQMISDMVAGVFIPLYFFPAWLAQWLQLLPFSAAFHIPLSIYIGKISGMEIFFALGQQLFWIFLLAGFAGFVWDRAKKKIYSQGG